MPTVFFLCEELQKHWPSVQLDASSKVSKYTTDLSKIKQVSSSTPNFFFANIYLQNYAHHVDSSYLASSGDLLSVQFLEFTCLIFSVTLRGVVT